MKEKSQKDTVKSGGDDKPTQAPEREFEYDTPHEPPKEKGKQ